MVPVNGHCFDDLWDVASSAIRIKTAMTGGRRKSGKNGFVTVDPYQRIPRGRQAIWPDDTEENDTMSTTTMRAATTRAAPTHTEGVSHLLPLLVAIALLTASAVVSVLLSGPLH